MSKDFRHGFTDLDDRLIEEANPYTEETVSSVVGDNHRSSRSLVRLRVLSGVAAAALIVVIGIVAAKNGWFKKLRPTDQKPVATPTASPTTPTPPAEQYETTPTPTMPVETTPTPEQPVFTPTPTMPVENTPTPFVPTPTPEHVSTPTPTMPVENTPTPFVPTPTPEHVSTPTPTMSVEATPTPTITPRQNPEPTPMGLQEKKIPDDARELSMSEVKQSDWFKNIPEDTFHFYDIINAYTYEDEAGSCVLLRMVRGSHLANEYILTPDGAKINWDLKEEDEVYEYDAEVYVTIRKTEDVPQFEARKIKASETERYDITKSIDGSITEDQRLTLEQPIIDAAELSDEVIKLRTKAVKGCFPHKMVVTLGVVSGEYLLDYEYCGLEFANAMAAFGDEAGWENYSYGSFSRNSDGTWPICYPGWAYDDEAEGCD